MQLTLAQSGVAATCVPGGRTIQSAFAYNLGNLARSEQRIRNQFCKVIAGKKKHRNKNRFVISKKEK